MHENRETSQTPGAAVATGRREKATSLQDSHARLGGVGQRCSTSERLEQRWETIGGERGGKTADQGEHQAVAHEPDTARGKRVPETEWCAESSQGKEEGEV